MRNELIQESRCHKPRGKSNFSGKQKIKKKMFAHIPEKGERGGTKKLGLGLFLVESRKPKMTVGSSLLGWGVVPSLTSPTTAPG